MWAMATGTLYWDSLPLNEEAQHCRHSGHFMLANWFTSQASPGCSILTASRSPDGHDDRAIRDRWACIDTLHSHSHRLDLFLALGTGLIVMSLNAFMCFILSLYCCIFHSFVNRLGGSHKAAKGGAQIEKMNKQINWCIERKLHHTC